MGPDPNMACDEGHTNRQVNIPTCETNPGSLKAPQGQPVGRGGPKKTSQDCTYGGGCRGLATPGSTPASGDPRTRAPHTTPPTTTQKRRHSPWGVVSRVVETGWGGYGYGRQGVRRCSLRSPEPPLPLSHLDVHSTPAVKSAPRGTALRVVGDGAPHQDSTLPLGGHQGRAVLASLRERCSLRSHSS